MTEDTIARDRNGLEVLAYRECLELLASREVGRIAFVDAGTPVIVPANYVLDGANVVIRSAAGSKLDTAERGRALAFEIDHHDADTRTGWSVLVTGVIEPVEASEELDRLDEALDTWALGDRDDVRMLRLRAETITGRRIGGSPTSE